MNYAFMSFSCPQATMRDVIGLAKKHGYTGFEPRVDSNHAHSIELDMSAAERKQVKDISAENGIEICCLALGSNFVNPKTTQAELDKTQHYLDLAADTGIKRLRIFGGNLEGVSREKATDLLVSSLDQLAAPARDRSLTLCLETHDGWCDPDHVARVMTTVNSPAIAINWDIMHPVRAGGKTMIQAFEILRPWIKHVHVHDGENTLDHLKMLPMGTGDFDNKMAIKLLNEANYNGFISGEWIENTMEETFFKSHLGEELEVLKRYESEA